MNSISGLGWSGGDGDTWTPGAGYTLRQSETNNASAERIASEDRVITTATTTNATFTVTTNEYWAAMVASFKPLVTTTGGGGSSTSTTAYTYDNNGNLLTAGTSTYSWNYRNRLMTAGNGLATSSYLYDHADNRVHDQRRRRHHLPPEHVLQRDSDLHHQTPLCPRSPHRTIDWTAGSSGTSSATIALDATTTNITNGYTGGPVTKTWSHTTSGTNRLLVLSASIWQDVARHRHRHLCFLRRPSPHQSHLHAHGRHSEEVWYLVNPPTGSNTVSVTVTGATDAIKLAVSTWTGVDQSTPIPVYTYALGVSGNPTISLTTTSANNVVLASLDRFSTRMPPRTVLPLPKTLQARSLQLRATSKLPPQALIRHLHRQRQPRLGDACHSDEACNPERGRRLSAPPPSVTSTPTTWAPPTSSPTRPVRCRKRPITTPMVHRGPTPSQGPTKVSRGSILGSTMTPPRSFPI